MTNFVEKCRTQQRAKARGQKQGKSRGLEGRSAPLAGAARRDFFRESTKLRFFMDVFFLNYYKYFTFLGTLREIYGDFQNIVL